MRWIDESAGLVGMKVSEGEPAFNG
jgi:hypothetical protein